jgi:hypothetical protein
MFLLMEGDSTRSRVRCSTSIQTYQRSRHFLCSEDSPNKSTQLTTGQYQNSDCLGDEINPRQRDLSSVLLTATLLAGAALVLPLALLAFTFLFVATLLSFAAFLSKSARSAWFVRIPLCFHLLPFPYVYQLLTGPFAVCDKVFCFF